ncbi:MAG: NTP transferase domain-containing protein [Candidatus Bathyarchaeota archaeon]|nr:MAG: NTP transferase domain-containing protein [Candidatus Bathyarchaeota archaeon]
MKAVILAAGEGVRLQPLTLTRPKHLISIGGKPLLEHILDSLKMAGLNEALIIVYYMSDKLQQFFGDGSRLGMELNYLLQDRVRGTADAAGLAKSYADEDFLLIYGDLVVTPDIIQKIISLHEERKPTATMAVTPVEYPEHYGIVKLDDSHVKDIIEKPSPEEAPTNLANTGIYVLSPEIFEKIAKTPTSKRDELEITDSLRLLIREKPVLAVQIPREEWLDVGRPWDLLEANRRILNRTESIVNGEIEHNAHLIGQVAVAKGARIRSGAYVEGPVFIDEDSDIGPNCYIRPHTSIGRNVRIGNACEVKNSIIMDKTHVGHLSYVGDSIIGEDCNLGAGTTIANFRLDDKTVKMTTSDEVVDTQRRKLGVILGDGVKTGIHTLFMPGVKIGQDSWIGPNLVVNQDVPPDTFLLLKQETEQREKKN